MSRLPQLEKMLAAEPNDVFLNFALAMELAKACRNEDALAAFVRTTEVDPTYVPGWFQRGNLLINLGRRDEAKTVLAEGRRVAEANGDHHAAAEIGDALNLLG